MGWRNNPRGIAKSTRARDYAKPLEVSNREDSRHQTAAFYHLLNLLLATNLKNSIQLLFLQPILATEK